MPVREESERPSLETRPGDGYPGGDAPRTADDNQNRRRHRSGQGDLFSGVLEAEREP